MNREEDGTMADRTEKGRKNMISNLRSVIEEQSGFAFMVALLMIVTVSLATLFLVAHV
jgi:hypothetical protein